MPFTEAKITAMQAEIVAFREHVHKLMVVGEIVASNRIFTSAAALWRCRTEGKEPSAQVKRRQHRSRERK